MTVQELINELNNIEDKEMEVMKEIEIRDGYYAGEGIGEVTVRERRNIVVLD